MARPRKQAWTGTILPRKSAEHGTVYQLRFKLNNRVPESGGYEAVGPDRKEAEQLLALRLGERNRGLYREHKDAKLLEFASEWFGRHKARLRPSAVERWRNDLEVHLLPFFGEYYLSQITVELVERYVEEKLAQREAGDRLVEQLELEHAAKPSRGTAGRLYRAKRERGLGASSVNKTLQRMEQMLDAAVKYDYLTRNPVHYVERLKTTKPQIVFLELDQLEAFMHAVPEKYSALMATLVLAGLRIGEACALRWADVDLLGQRITVTRTFNPQTGEEGPVKTGEAGSVDFGQHLLEVLLAHKPETATDADLVFSTSAGRNMHPSNIRTRGMKPAIERANAVLALSDTPTISPDLTPHGLRHTYCSILVSQNEPWSLIAEQMRHADIATTQRYYSHAMKHKRSGISERLDATLRELKVAFKVANGPVSAPAASTFNTTTRMETAI